MCFNMDFKCQNDQICSDNRIKNTELLKKYCRLSIFDSLKVKFFELNFAFIGSMKLGWLLKEDEEVQQGILIASLLWLLKVIDI